MYCTFNYLKSRSLLSDLKHHFTYGLLFADTCSEGDIRLSNGSSLDYPNGYRESSGRVEVCINGEYVDVCPGSVDVQQVCSYLGYTGTLLCKGNNDSTDTCTCKQLTV